MWQSWLEAFAVLSEHQHRGVAKVGKLGHPEALRRRDSALERERLEQVYGP